MGASHIQVSKLVHSLEEIEDKPRFGFVNARQGEPDVHDDVLADLNFGHVLQTDVFENTAEINLAHEHIVLLVGARHFAGDPKTHRPLLRKLATASLLNCFNQPELPSSADALAAPSIGGMSRRRQARKPSPFNRVFASLDKKAFMNTSPL
jgi:hypothetical protein